MVDSDADILYGAEPNPPRPLTIALLVVVALIGATTWYVLTRPPAPTPVVQAFSASVGTVQRSGRALSFDLMLVNPTTHPVRLTHLSVDGLILTSRRAPLTVPKHGHAVEHVGLSVGDCGDLGQGLLYEPDYPLQLQADYTVQRSAGELVLKVPSLNDLVRDVCRRA